MKLELYHFESCPYCKKVRTFVESNNLKSQVTYFDILKDEAAHARLMKLNAEDEQVPCLIVDGKPILESDDIIEFLKTKVMQK
jgi:glutaredoxin